MNRSTSIRHRHTGREPVDEGMWDEEDDLLEVEDIPDSNFELLETSLPGRIDGKIVVSL